MKAWRDIDDITCRITPADIVGMRSTAVTAHAALRYPFLIAPAHINFACNQLTAPSTDIRELAVGRVNTHPCDSLQLSFAGKLL